MQKTLFVHIGVHKTGTTAIQTHFAVYAPLFRFFGLHYPRLGGGFRYRNQDIAEDIKSSKGNFKTIGTYTAAIRKSKLPRHLLSAETFFTQERAPEYFEQFSKIARVQIVMFVRRQDRFLESIYRQIVKNDTTAATAHFFQFARSRVRPSDSSNRVDWLDRLRPWVEKFGHENITIIPYPEYRRLDSVNSMADVLGVPFAKRLPRLDFGDNSSLSCETVEFLRRLRKEGVSFRPKKLIALDRLLENRSYAYIPFERRKLMVSRFAKTNNPIGVQFGCDVSGITEFRNEIEAARRLFSLEQFDDEKMRSLAQQCGLLI